MASANLAWGDSLKQPALVAPPLCVPLKKADESVELDELKN